MQVMHGSAGSAFVRFRRDKDLQCLAILADHTQIGQVVLNLLTNAMQALEGTGRIHLRAHAASDRETS